MIVHTWKIEEVDAKDGLITEVKYRVKATQLDIMVETEGYWRFGDPVLSVPFEEVTEEMVVGWVKQDSMQDGKNLIESRLEEQVMALSKNKVIPPWLPQVFTPNLG